MKLSLLGFACVVAFVGGVARAQLPLGTAFTYQGELQEAGVPVAGTYDLRFRICEGAAACVLPSPTLCVNDVSVVNGRFTVVLDFGAAFRGNEGFLEIEVRVDAGLGCADATGFVVLVPRQQLTVSPNAAYSLNAGAAATAGDAELLNGQNGAFYRNASNLNAGTLPSARFSGVYSTAVTLSNAANSLTGSHFGSGAGLTSLNASTISSGMLADARLSSNVALLNNVQTFTAGKVFSVAPAFTAVGVPFTVSSSTFIPNLHADLLDGLDASAFLQAVPNPLSLIGSHAASQVIYAENISAAAGSSGLYAHASSASAGISYGVVGVSQGTSGIGVLGQALGNTGITFGVEGRADSPDGTGVHGTGQAIGVWGESSNTNGEGVYGRATAATGDARGVYGLSDSTAGTGVYGYANANSGVNYGVYGRSDSTSGTGVFGYVEAGSGVVSGVRGDTDSTSGRAIFGVSNGLSGTSYGGRFENDSTSGRGVFAWATTSTGTTYGVSGRSDSSSGRGVYGDATADSGSNYGVYGESDSVSGRGVYGEVTATTGVNYGGEFVVNTSSSNGAGALGVSLDANGGGFGLYGQAWGQTGRGVYGVAFNNNSTSYGVYGSAGSNGFGVFCGGDFAASGTKSFRIDHPDDPENRYLVHYSAESPEVINFYRGTVTLDADGAATVELPAYFAKVNRDPSYTLTAVGSAMPLLHVAEEIDEGLLARGASSKPPQGDPACSFRIAGGAAGGKVSWRVEAVRNDASTRARTRHVEVDKVGLERGTYQHPELYNQPPERGINHVPAEAQRRPAPKRDRREDEQPR
ncbi:MAG: hypothetical protein ACKVS8_14470 [Phycisphaerales bacterium]